MAVWSHHLLLCCFWVSSDTAGWWIALHTHFVTTAPHRGNQTQLIAHLLMFSNGQKHLVRCWGSCTSQSCFIWVQPPPRALLSGWEWPDRAVLSFNTPQPVMGHGLLLLLGLRRCSTAEWGAGKTTPKQGAALTLHSRHHIRDPQFSPNQQATLEIEKALLKLPRQDLSDRQLLLPNSSVAQTLPRTLFRRITAPFEGWHNPNIPGCALCWVSTSLGRLTHTGQFLTCFLH